MNQKEYKEIVQKLIMYPGRPPVLYFTGPPGVGKTEMILQVVDSLNKASMKKEGKPAVGCGLFHAGSKTMDWFLGMPETIIRYKNVLDDAGNQIMVPKLNDDGVIMLDSDKNAIMVPKRERIADCIWTTPEPVRIMHEFEGLRCIAFFDDIHLVRGEERKIFFEAFTDFTIHGHKLPDNCLIVCAGNPTDAEHGATVTDIPLPIRSRFVKLDLVADVDLWINASVARQINPLIIGAVRFDPTVFSTAPGESGQYSCPRSLWTLSKLIDVGLDFSLANITGCVGEHAASKIVAFHTIYEQFEKSLPDKYEQLDFNKKVALTSYMMVKKDIKLFKRFIPGMSDDPNSSAILTMAMRFAVRTFPEKQAQELMDYVKNQEFLASLGESI